MQLPQLYEGVLIKRYKRFLVDVKLQNNSVVVAHCPNSGSMMGLNKENYKVFVSKQTNPQAKLKYKLELVESPLYKSLVGINTSLTNKIVHEAMLEKQIDSLKNYTYIKPESKFQNSRFDFFLKDNNSNECYIEVKNVTLLRNNNIAEFPDAKTIRGTKHLQDLTEAKKIGKRAINIYVIQINDIKKFCIAKDIDPQYYEYYIKAKENGVEFLCYNCIVTQNNIKLNQRVEML